MLSKIKCANSKIFCYKNKSLASILAFMKGYSISISSIKLKGKPTNHEVTNKPSGPFQELLIRSIFLTNLMGPVTS